MMTPRQLSFSTPSISPAYMAARSPFATSWATLKLLGTCLRSKSITARSLLCDNCMLKSSLPVRLASPIIVRLPPSLNFGATTLISQLECSGFMANLPTSKLNNFAAIVSGACDPYSWIFPGDGNAMLIISQRTSPTAERVELRLKDPRIDGSLWTLCRFIVALRFPASYLKVPSTPSKLVRATP